MRRGADWPGNRADGSRVCGGVARRIFERNERSGTELYAGIFRIGRRYTPNWTDLNSEIDEDLRRIGRPVSNCAAKPESNFVARHAEGLIRTALGDTRIFALVGPRQSGKTTLVRRIAERDGRPFVTLDDDQFRRFAQDDPVGFMRTRQPAVIDEIQRAPDLILALKKAVDEDPRPGRFSSRARLSSSRVPHPLTP